MHWSICPHDMVKQLQTWLDLAIYLQKHLDEHLVVNPVTDFALFYEHDLPKAELAFVNPLDAWHLVHERGFVPVARTELYDEVVFITHPDDPADRLDALHDQPLAAVDRQFATCLGLYVLREQDLTPREVVFQPSWVQVIRAVAQRNVRFGLLYQDFYAGLSALSRAQFRVLHETHTRYATHMLLLHPDRVAWREPLRAVLTAMPADPEGAALLRALRLGRWVPAEDLGGIEPVVQVPVPGRA